MNYFTIRRRLKVLNEFKENYSKWRKTVQRNMYTNNLTNGDTKLREKVNALIPEAIEAVNDVGFGVYDTMPAPLFGGYAFKVNVIHSCLLLDLLYSRNLSSQSVIDDVNKAIAVYKREKKIAFFNLPLSCVKWLLRIPFMILENLGFAEFSKKNELNKWGKFIKIAWFGGFLSFVIKLLSVAADLQTFGLLRKIWYFIKCLLAGNAN